MLEAFVAGHMQRTSFALHNASDAHAHAAVSHAAALLSAVRSKLRTHQRPSFALYDGSGVLDALNAETMQRTSFALYSANDAQARAAVSHAAALLPAVQSKLTSHQRTPFALYNGSGVLGCPQCRNNATRVIRVV